jgi:hypothetical protein
VKHGHRLTAGGVPGFDARSCISRIDTDQRLSILDQALRQDDAARASRDCSRNHIVPKLIVVFFGAESPAVTLAEAARDGGKSVRFTEVDLRAGAGHQATTEQRHKRLESAEQIQEYDGVLLACPAAGDIPADLNMLLDALERSPVDALANTIFGVIGGENTVLLGRVARLGGIIVTEPRGVTDPEERARRLGARIAKMIEWVRHAQSHEAHGHAHHH